MPKPETGSLHLRRIDPASNMARFYALSSQPTLFGGASLVRNWGRIGTNGQAMMEIFDESADAGETFVRLERRKRKRREITPTAQFSGDFEALRRARTTTFLLLRVKQGLVTKRRSTFHDDRK